LNITQQRRLLSGKNAVMSEHDYAVVEDPNRGKGKNPIVACASLHRCLIYYGSVNFYVGKPELIATEPVSIFCLIALLAAVQWVLGALC
jgi:hypothetical protein